MSTPSPTVPPAGSRQSEPIRAECAVNKFDTEDEAVRHARAWSKDGTERSVIHAPSSSGLAFFVERGDGGMVTIRERFDSLLAACEGLLNAIHDSMTHESQAFHAEQINAAKAAIALAKPA